MLKSTVKYAYRYIHIYTCIYIYTCYIYVIYIYVCFQLLGVFVVVMSPVDLAEPFLAVIVLMIHCVIATGIVVESKLLC